MSDTEPIEVIVERRLSDGSLVNRVLSRGEDFTVSAEGTDMIRVEVREAEDVDR